MVWTRPGLLLIGDAAHPMSPVGGQGINIALRDAVVSANHVLGAIRSGDTDLGVLDAAATKVQRERMPEVRSIQRAQQLPPQVLFGPQIITRSVLALLPALVWTGIAQRAAGGVLRRFAFGADQVQLQV
jgi:2-polyprenyl-6-methoxyphenol hydroxylase-like FAD-dependent oxidoreductase